MGTNPKYSTDLDRTVLAIVFHDLVAFIIQTTSPLRVWYREHAVPIRFDPLGDHRIGRRLNC